MARKVAENSETAKVNAVIPIKLNQQIEDFREMKQDFLQQKDPKRKVLKAEAINDFLEMAVPLAEKAVLEENFVDRKIEE